MGLFDVLQPESDVHQLIGLKVCDCCWHQDDRKRGKNAREKGGGEFHFRLQNQHTPSSKLFQALFTLIFVKPRRFRP